MGPSLSSVGSKMYCVVGLSETPTSASFKVTAESFDEISNRSGFKPAPYVAKHKWVLAEDISTISKGTWEDYIRQSYELVRDKLPLKVKKIIAADS